MPGRRIDRLGVVERRVAQRVRTRLVALDRWDDGFDRLLSNFGMAVAVYLDRRAQLRADPRRADDAVWMRELAQWHWLARSFMADFTLIERGRVPLAPLDANGDDAELVALAAEG